MKSIGSRGLSTFWGFIPHQNFDLKIWFNVAYENLILLKIWSNSQIFLSDVPPFPILVSVNRLPIIDRFQNYAFYSHLFTLDRSQNISLHFICITFHLHYITFAFKNHATSA